MAVTRTQTGTAQRIENVRALTVSLPRAATAGRVIVSCIAVNKSSGVLPTAAGFPIPEGRVATSVTIAATAMVARGGETDCAWSWSAGNAQNAAAWIAELDGFTSGLITPLLVASNYTNESNVTSCALGPLDTAGEAYALALAGVDTATGWGSDATWSGSFTRAAAVIAADGLGATDVGLFVGERIVSSSTSLSTTATAAGGAGDQASGLMLVLGVGAAEPAQVVTQRAGIPSADGVEVVVKLDDGARGRLVVSTSSDLSSPIVGEEATVDGQLVLRVAADGLEADTAYHYGVEVDGVLLSTGRGQFRTAPAGAASFSVAHASCAHPFHGVSPVGARIAASGAEWMVLHGDQFYPDEYRDLTVTGLRSAYDSGSTATGLDEVEQAMPVVRVWDDHDCGEDAAAASVAAAAQVFREREPGTLPHATAIYDTWPWGRTRWVLLDCRSQRDPVGDTDDAAKSMLGADQLAWLDGVMSTATEPVIFVISSVPWNDPRASSGEDGWGRYDTERAALIARWTTAGVLDRIVMISGDAHMIGADDGTNAPGGIPCVQAAPFGHGSGTIKGGTFSQGTIAGTQQYGLLAVSDTGGDTIAVDWTGYGNDGRAAITLGLSFDVGHDAAGSAELAVSAAVTASGAKLAAGSGEASASVIVEATGAKHASGSATVTLTAGLAASGDGPRPATQVRIRERMPLGIHVTSDAPGGATHRWGRDEPAAADRPSGERWSDTMPGGFDRFGCVLPRKPGVDYSDLKPMTTLTARNHAGSSVWQGRLERAPRTSGDQMAISPDAVGWQAHLEDDRSASGVFIDGDLSRWNGAAAERRLALLDGVTPASDPSAAWARDSPALELTVSGAWAAPSLPRSEGWYDAGAGNRVSRVVADFYASASVDASWRLFAVASSDDTASITESSVDAYSGTDGSFDFQPSARHRYAFVYWQPSTTPGGTDGGAVAVQLKNLKVFGDSDLAVRGSGANIGMLASDVAPYIVGRWAPLLRFTTGASGTIAPSSFVIPQIAFYDPTTVAAMLQEILKYELPDWAVWDERWLYIHPRGARGRRWRARVASSGLEETGPQIDRIWNGILVQYQDVDGSTRTVGPPGSGVDVEDPQLLDADPENPANQLNIRRWDILQMGIVSTAAGAVQVGARFLAESRLLSTAGRATLTGYVMDEHGVLWPYHEVRAGDSVSFVDAADPSWRRITQAEKDASSRSCTVSLDSPPEGLGALLARWGLTLVPLGL